MVTSRARRGGAPTANERRESMTPTPAEPRSALHPALSARQGFALLEESEAARNLMRDSIRAIRDMRHVRTDGDTVFSLGSIGTEKTMKVMLGCKAVEDEDSWPTNDQLRRWGHDIEKLNALMLAAISDGMERSGAPGDSARLGERITASKVIPLVFAVFARYGKSGRFHHLNILATDEPGELDQPSEYWDRVELHVRETRPEFQEIPFGDDRAFNSYQERLRGFIANELDAWWFCVHRLGVQGCFGELGKMIGREIWESGRPEPSAVRYRAT
ncbi:hypothetical protein M8542_41140 [Amycolatopsis sp. OK19-0408]|uniref:Uncharacterized protein n=1 Tax=Amycolatopsis iheyensis TaxID=2945988 RepID=A0A9X2NPI0_9PSEU|nr:hypothetical protein [Amycolatopsis iheyensis]MCR6489240.1 hypothetical protein [Amycolatopsis iheyensis]